LPAFAIKNQAIGIKSFAEIVLIRKVCRPSDKLPAIADIDAGAHINQIKGIPFGEIFPHNESLPRLQNNRLQMCGFCTTGAAPELTRHKL